MGDFSNFNRETPESVPLLEQETIKNGPEVHNPDLNSCVQDLNDVTKDKDKEEPKLSNLSGRRRAVVILCSAAHLLTGVSFSLLGPFYASEAAKKGMSLPLTGFVFGLFDLVIFLASPFIGNYLTTLGPKFIYLSGIFIGGGGTILFGTVHYCAYGAPFIATSIISRFIGAAGVAAYSTASFAIVTSEYTENVGTVIGIMETAIGIGYMTGPAVGGALFDLGGFGLPFYVTGVLVFLNGILIYKCLPPISDAQEKRKNSMISLLRNPLVVIPMFSVLIGFFAIGTYDSTFARHLEHFKLSTSIIGLFFAITAGIYAIMAPVWGYIIDKTDIQAPIIIVGHLVFGLGFYIVGPSQFLPFIPFELWAMGVGPVCIGSSFGCILIPTMKCMVKGALELGFDNNIDTYALVSGLYNSVYCFGGFLGPVAGGAILEAYGYPTLFTVLGTLSISMTFVTLVFFSIRNFRQRHNTSGRHHAGSSTDTSCTYLPLSVDTNIDIE